MVSGWWLGFVMTVILDPAGARAACTEQRRSERSRSKRAPPFHKKGHCKMKHRLQACQSADRKEDSPCS